jgi:hypothetical protein
MGTSPATRVLGPEAVADGGEPFEQAARWGAAS